MAEGENILDVTQYPDAFQYVSVTLSTDTVDVERTHDAYIMYCDRTIIVDAAFISFTSRDTSNNATYQLQYVPSGLQDTAGVTPIGPEGAGTAFSDAVFTGSTNDASVEFTITETANVIPAGNRIAVLIDGAASDTEGVNITLRIRTRRK